MYLFWVYKYVYTHTCHHILSLIKNKQSHDNAYKYVYIYVPKINIHSFIIYYL